MENFFIRELAVAFLWWIYPQWLKKRWNAISEWLKIGSSSRVETWSRRWRRPKKQFFIAIRGLHNCHGWWLLSDQSTAPYVVKYWTPSEQLLAFNSLIRNYNVKKRKRNQSHPKSIQTKTRYSKINSKGWWPDIWIHFCLKFGLYNMFLCLLMWTYSRRI